MTAAPPDPLPSRVGNYVADGNHDATPDEVLAECDLDESRREQVEYYLAVTRYGIYNDHEANDGEDLAFHSVEWSDVDKWDVTPRNREE